jgi:imidazolonepropionase-like amidohydrolase
LTRHPRVQNLEFTAIRAGRSADIVALPGDPTQDVRLLENIPFVRQGGNIYKQ